MELALGCGMGRGVPSSILAAMANACPQNGAIMSEAQRGQGAYPRPHSRHGSIWTRAQDFWLSVSQEGSGLAGGKPRWRQDHALSPTLPLQSIMLTMQGKVWAPLQVAWPGFAVSPTPLPNQKVPSMGAGQLPMDCSLKGKAGSGWGSPIWDCQGPSGLELLGDPT